MAKEVTDDEDFIRIIKEVSIKLDIPEKVVKKIIENLIRQLQFTIKFKHLKRISLWGFININIKNKKLCQKNQIS